MSEVGKKFVDFFPWWNRDKQNTENMFWVEEIFLDFKLAKLNRLAR